MWNKKSEEPVEATAPEKKAHPGPNWGVGKYGSVTYRTAMLMAHYTAPITWTDSTLPEAEKVWRRMFARAEKTDEPPPDEVVAAVKDNLNTPRALAVVHGFVRAKQGKKVWSALNYLGLLPLEGEPVPTVTDADRA